MTADWPRWRREARRLWLGWSVLVSAGAMLGGIVGLVTRENDDA